jgi:hypothetical protein
MKLVPFVTLTIVTFIWLATGDAARASADEESGPIVCNPGSSQVCAVDSQSTGSQICNSLGTGYSDCEDEYDSWSEDDDHD